MLLHFQEHRGLLNIRYPMEVSEEFVNIIDSTSVKLMLGKSKKCLRP